MSQSDPPINSAFFWRRNLRCMRFLAFFEFALVIFPVFVPLMQSYGLSMAQIMFSQSVFAISTVILEIPSGVFADRFGRYMSLVIGSLLIGVAFTILFFARTFEMICLFELVAALALSLMSGADTSLAFESEKALGLPAGSELEKIHAWYSWGEAVASITCVVVLLFSDFSTLLLLQMLIGWLIFLCVLPMREPPRERCIESCTVAVAQDAGRMISAITQMRALRDDLRGVSHLPVMLLFYLSISAWTYFSWWAMQPLMLHHDVPEMAFGLVYAMMHLTIGFSARWVTVFQRSLSRYVFHGVLPGIMIVSFLIFQLPWLWAVVFGAIGMSVIRGIVVPLVKISLNAQVGDARRATLNSVLSALFRLMTALLGPMVGAFMDRYGVYSTLDALIIFAVPGVAFLLLWQYRVKNDKSLEMVSASSE